MSDQPFRLVLVLWVRTILDVLLATPDIDGTRGVGRIHKTRKSTLSLDKSYSV